jgi:hypothetical protein
LASTYENALHIPEDGNLRKENSVLSLCRTEYTYHKGSSVDGRDEKREGKRFPADVGVNGKVMLKIRSKDPDWIHLAQNRIK